MKSYFLSAWNTLDPVYFFFTRLHYVLDQNKRKTLFRVRLTRYKGATVLLKDGTLIQKNDLLIKIHLHNARIINELHQMKSEMKRAIVFYHMVKEALPALAQYVLSHHKKDEIKGIIGITSLYKGANRLGFEVRPIKNVYYRIFKEKAFFIINLLANNSYNENPVYLFMSKGQLEKKADKRDNLFINKEKYYQ